MGGQYSILVNMEEKHDFTTNMLGKIRNHDDPEY